MVTRFHDCAVYFDPKDRRNGSLYVFRERGAEVIAEKYIKRLMADALWTHGVTASVREDQRWRA
jgi:hypothetical protein